MTVGHHEGGEWCALCVKHGARLDVELRKAAVFMLDLVDQYYGTDHEFDIPEEAEFRRHRAVIESRTPETPDVERLGDAIDAMAEALNQTDQTLDGLPDTNAAQETIDSLADVAKAWLKLVDALRAVPA